MSQDIPMLSIIQLVEEALQCDGGHHKQWYLEQIGLLIGIDLSTIEHERGIAP